MSVRERGREAIRGRRLKRAAGSEMGLDEDEYLHEEPNGSARKEFPPLLRCRRNNRCERTLSRRCGGRGGDG